jgi:predicted AAA+ superfamily ATPase
MFAKERTPVFFDLESQLDLNRLQNPQLMLGPLRGLVIIDEIQAMPELFRWRVLVDRPENKTRFLILGSASPDLVKNVSETLAGRVEFVELSGFGLHEARQRQCCLAQGRISPFFSCPKRRRQSRLA